MQLLFCMYAFNHQRVRTIFSSFASENQVACWIKLFMVSDTEFLKATTPEPEFRFSGFTPCNSPGRQITAIHLVRVMLLCAGVQSFYCQRTCIVSSSDKINLLGYRCTKLANSNEEHKMKWKQMVCNYLCISYCRTVYVWDRVWNFRCG